MCRIPCTVRIDGRYVYRRRVHFRNLISKLLPIALRTADPNVARRRAALLSARFMLVKLDVDMMLETGRLLTGAEVEAIFRQKLEDELSFFVHSANENASWSPHVLKYAAEQAEAYRLMCLPDRHLGMTDTDRAAFVGRGLADKIPWIEEHMREIREALDDQEVIRRLDTIGAPTHAQAVAFARSHLIRAGAAACTRVARTFDAATLEAPDPVRFLMSDLGEPPPPSQGYSRRAARCRSARASRARSAAKPVSRGR